MPWMVQKECLTRRKLKGFTKTISMLLWDHRLLQELRKVCAFMLFVFDQILIERENTISSPLLAIITK